MGLSLSCPSFLLSVAVGQTLAEESQIARQGPGTGSEINRANAWYSVQNLDSVLPSSAGPPGLLYVILSPRDLMTCAARS